MIASVVVYAVVTSLLLAPAAWLAERAAALSGLPRRFIWTTAVGLLAMLTVTAHGRDESGTAVARFVDAGAGPLKGGLRVFDTVSETLRLRFDGVVTGVAAYDVWLLAMWILLSLTVGLACAAGRWQLARRKRGWVSAEVHGRAVLISDNTGPAVIGLVSPVVVLPRWALALEPSALTTILSHERQHVAAGDAWFVHAAALATVVMPWNPVVWWMAARLRLAVEIDCDARVLAAGPQTPEDVARYGELLLAVATRRPQLTAGVTAALIESSSTLSRRITAMSQSDVSFRRRHVVFAGGVAAAMFVAACSVPVPSAPHEDAAGSGIATVNRTEMPAAFERGQVSSGANDLATGFVNPAVLSSPRPHYPAAALARKVEGSVLLEAVVDAAGHVADARVTRPLDPDLDASAVAAARTWRFEPGKRDGEPVAMAVTLEMQFILR